MMGAVLGVGVMGEIILRGWLAAGVDPTTIAVTDQRAERQAEVAARYGVTGLPSVAAVRDADTVLIIVKPQDVPALLGTISPVLRPDALVVSLAAGVTTATLEAGLPAGQPVIRVMPNTPASVGEGMAVLSPGQHAKPAHLDRASQILAAVGRVEVVPEKYQDAVTAISGSGPAYIMLVAEAMIEAGVLLGLPRATATALTTQTIFGSAKLLRDSGQHPTLLRESVTSPGGTTAAALREFETHRLTAAFMDAMEAACQRSQALGREAA
ncbi:MAG: pyrroline-5-carboxylate reductase [Propionibacteriaceae bacterium]|jgi:pyrroline-5-carboxylate reductase|nr:pyrroline-5-carboxylate reductase [Propionibacteriaceae bacterium]